MIVMSILWGLIYSNEAKTSKRNYSSVTNFITITDSKGKQANVPCYPQRIVALGGSYGVETLLAFGMKDKIIAVADYAKKREDLKLFLKNIPDVGGSSKPNIEKILAMKPDLVLAYAIYSYPEMEAVLKERGIPLVQMDFFKPDKYVEEVRLLGKILQKEKRAEELIDFEKRYLSFIAKRVKNVKPEKKIHVYLESYKEYQSVSEEDEKNNAIVACGGVNIFSDQPIKNPQVSSEAIVGKNPDLIIKLMNSQTCPSGYGVTNSAAVEKLRKKIMQRPGWQNLNAVKKGEVKLISTDTHSIHPSVFYSYLAKAIYPQLFLDLNPTIIHREWMQKFLGIKLIGIYAYPDKYEKEGE